MSEPLYVDAAEKRSFGGVLAENERLKEAIRRLADQDATLSVCDGNVTVTLDGTLTDAEREAIEWAVARIIDFSSSRDEDKKAAVLRGLLDRLGGER